MAARLLPCLQFGLHCQHPPRLGAGSAPVLVHRRGAQRERPLRWALRRASENRPRGPAASQGVC
eukprot:4518567-Pleurochrysis_carterae.AAC.1